MGWKITLYTYKMVVSQTGMCFKWGSVSGEVLFNIVNNDSNDELLNLQQIPSWEGIKNFEREN